jgi:hypothetical protein
LLNGGDSSSSYFARLLGEGDSALLPGASTDTDGVLFIDRDGEIFKHVLDWLRGGLLPKTLDARTRERLEEEAAFYGLTRLQAELCLGYNPLLLSAADAEVLESAQRWRGALRGAAAEAQAVATADEEYLIDVLRERDSFRYDGHFEGAGLLFAHRRAKHDGIQASTLKDFEDRLHLFAGPCLEGLDMSNLVIAGGSVHASLLLSDPRSRDTQRLARKGESDIDLFLIAPDSDKSAGDRVARQIFKHLAEKVRACWTSDLDRSVCCRHVRFLHDCSTRSHVHICSRARVLLDTRADIGTTKPGTTDEASRRSSRIRTPGCLSRGVRTL